MVDIEKEVEIDSSRIITRPRQEAPRQAFSRDTLQSTDTELKQFNTYKPVDLNQIFSKLNSETEVQKKPEVKESVEFETIQKFNKAKFPVIYNEEVSTEKQAALKINLRGKLVIMVASVMLVLLAFLAIYNAVAMGRVNASIQAIDAQIVTQTEVLNAKKDAYILVTDEAVLASRAENAGFAEIPDENKYTLSIAEQSNASSTVRTNWFDKVCEFFAQLFS